MTTDQLTKLCLDMEARLNRLENTYSAALDEQVENAMPAKAAPPELPGQWRHESDPPKKRIMQKGERYWHESGNSRAADGFSVGESHWPIVPAMPRPADPKGYRVTEWKKATEYSGEWISIGGYIDEGMPSSKLNGFRWHVESVKAEAEVRADPILECAKEIDHYANPSNSAWRQEKLITKMNIIKKYAPAIAREQVIEELERLKSKSVFRGNANPFDIVTVTDFDTRLAELREGE